MNYGFSWYGGNGMVIWWWYRYGAVNALQSQRSESLASVELMCAIFRRKPYDSSRMGSRGLAMMLLGMLCALCLGLIV